MTDDRAAIIAELRARLNQEAPFRSRPVGLEMGHPSLDAALGGWPQPGVAEVTGAVGSGRVGLVLPALVALSQADRPVAVVDVPGWLNPPGLPGVAMGRLVLVRPGAGPAAWATEQLLRCGALPLVVLLDPPRLGRGARRLLRAAEDGGSTLVVLNEKRDAELPASLRLEMVGTGAVRVSRSVVPGAVGRTLPTGARAEG